MKIAALILGLLGSLLLFMVGVMWTDDANHINDVEQMAKTYQEAVKQLSQTTGKAIPEDPKAKEAMEKLDVVRGHARSAYPMTACGFVAFIAAFFVFKWPKVVGVIFALAVLIPAVLYVGSLIASSLLILATLFAFLVKPKQVVVTPAPAP